MGIVAIFLAMLVCIFVRPFKIRIWIFTSVFATIVVVLGYIDFKDMGFIFSLIWDSSLCLIALIVVSLCLESLGFFNKVVLILVKFCRVDSPESKISINGNQLFLFLFITAGICAVFLGNDGAILILTPLCVGVFSALHFKDSRLIIAALFTTSFICDSNSNTLVISNLTNIITANYFKLDFVEFLKIMLLPNVIALVASICIFFLLFKVPKVIELSEFRSKNPINTLTFVSCIAILIAFIVACVVCDYLSLPLSIPCVCVACIFFVLNVLSDKSQKASRALWILKNAPFSIVIFSFGLFIVVFALYKHELQTTFQALLSLLGGNMLQNLFSVGFFSAIFSSIFNNLPMVLLGDVALEELFSVNAVSEEMQNALIYAHLLGCNIGSKFTIFGSLCTLLWLSILQKRGFLVSFKQYCIFGLIFTLPTLCLAILGLYFSLLLVY